MATRSASRLRRPRVPMPAAIRELLAKRGLMEAYQARPAYQRNDYLGWILRAKQEATRERRLRQMLEELEQGDVYLKMNWRAPAARARAVKPPSESARSTR